VAWPLAARAQQGERVRRVGVLMPYNENDATSDVIVKSQISAFVQGLSELGWITGRNLRMDFRWSAGSVDLARRYAKELVDIQPDAIFVESTPQTAALKQVTQIIPIVFVLVSDPVGSQLVAGLPRPGGNITGFTHLPGTMGSKWLELLTQMAPGIKRVAAMFNPDTSERF